MYVLTPRVNRNDGRTPTSTHCTETIRTALIVLIFDSRPTVIFPTKRAEPTFPYLIHIRKMVKGKKKTTENVNARLALVVKSGKYTLGFKSTIKTLRTGKAKLILIASNTAPLRKSELEYYAMLAKCQVHHFQGNNIDLGKFYIFVPR